MRKTVKRLNYNRILVPRTPLEKLHAGWKKTRQLRRQALRNFEYGQVKREFDLPRRVSREVARARAQKAFREGKEAGR
jgi:hypothetical protein